MLAAWEYHNIVRRLIPASVAGFALVVLVLLTNPKSQAQVNGTPPSVTSIGFGGHFDLPRGVQPSVTSPGPKGFTPNHQMFVQPFCCFKGQVPPEHPGRFPQRHPHTPFFPIGGAVYGVPYTPVYILDPTVEDSGPAVQPESYPAGPTIFDRRASEQSSAAVEAAYADRLRAERIRDDERVTPAPEPAVPPAATAVEDQPQTVLVFKDGHQLEVQNYAIVGSMLFDLTPGRHSKITIADLDLAATAKQNDDRGIDFQLPATPDTN